MKYLKKTKAARKEMLMLEKMKMQILKKGEEAYSILEQPAGIRYIENARDLKQVIARIELRIFDLKNLILEEFSVKIKRLEAEREFYTKDWETETVYKEGEFKAQEGTVEVNGKTVRYKIFPPDPINPVIIWLDNLDVDMKENEKIQVELIKKHYRKEMEELSKMSREEILVRSIKYQNDMKRGSRK